MKNELTQAKAAYADEACERLAAADARRVVWRVFLRRRMCRDTGFRKAGMPRLDLRWM